VYQGNGSPDLETDSIAKELLQCPDRTLNKTGVIIAVAALRMKLEIQRGVHALIGLKAF
jgi:hypothetical protein